MDSMDIYRAMEKAARLRLSQGDTAALVRREAAEQAATGFSVSAEYTRLLASIMASLERGER